MKKTEKIERGEREWEEKQRISRGLEKGEEESECMD